MHYIKCLTQRLLYAPFERTLGGHAIALVILLKVLLQATIPTVCHIRTVLAVIWLTVRVGDQMLSGRFPGEELFLTKLTLVRLQLQMYVPRVLQKVAGS